MPLETYRKKRNFSRTAEPAAGGVRGGRIFVVQLHHASRRHYDFRLELDGVLKSWAVPKGPSFDPAVKRLAVEVEDHPISYAQFEGDIAKGNYGAGHVDVFDSGTWEPEGSAREGLAKGDLKFTLHGNILKGSWVLVRTRMQGSKQQWLLIKHRDAFAGGHDVEEFVDPKTDRPIKGNKRKENSPAPRTRPASRAEVTATPANSPKLPGASIAERLSDGCFAPELCKPADSPPKGERWLHEAKWDGYRILASVVRGKVQLWSRNAIEWTAKVPELAEAVASLKLRSARLDGEMIALREGRDNFNALQGRLSAENADPVIYMLFDIVHANGRSLADVPLAERKAWLGQLLEAHPHPLLRFSEHVVGNGAEVFAQAVANGLEGVVSKRVDSVYTGTRSGAWVKSKGRLSDEFIVVGYTEPKGSRGGLGALLLAKPGKQGLHYVGRVGTGISADRLLSLRATLEKSIVRMPPADIERMSNTDRALAVWVKPRLVVEAFYQGIGGRGLLRQPAFKALRVDRTPADVSADTASTPAKATRKVTAGKSSSRAAEKPMSDDRVTVTHPDRVVFPELKRTKQDVADYYRAVAPWILADISGRPLSVVRCPGGIGAACFFQKHATKGAGENVRGVMIKEKKGRDRYLCIDNAAGLLELVQMNVLEFHPWAARSSDPEHCDRLVFDLDPHASVAWARVKTAARTIRMHIESIGLRSFLRTSGGKGLHVVVPLDPPAPWDAAREFSRAVAEAIVTLKPKEFVSVAGENKRTGRIFIDWLRNARGATSVASYSVRARPSAGVAMPLRWEDLARLKKADQFTLKNALAWIAKRDEDPWADIGSVEQSLPEI